MWDINHPWIKTRGGRDAHPADVLGVDALALALRQHRHVLLLRRLRDVEVFLMSRGLQMHLSYVRD